MALINKKKITPRETASYKLDSSTIELVKFYAEFIGSSQEHVVNEALVYIFRKDKEFNEWLTAQGKSNLLHQATADQANGSGKRQDTVAAPSLIGRGDKS